MSEYETKWVDIEDIERFLQINLDADTKPSDGEVLAFIDEVESGMLRERWGTQTAVSGTVMDVSPTAAVGRGSVAWFIQGLPESEVGRTIIPPYTPIVSVTSGSFYKNDATLDSAPDTELLVCKDNLPGAANTDFMVVKKFNHKTGNYDGIAFYFFHDIPYAGRRRVTGGYVYGYNINTKILREYAMLKVCEKVIFARLFSAQPTNVATYEGGDLNSYVNTQFDVQMAYIDKRTEEIAKKHFPVEFAIATVQGV